jgi:hypothetical protein
MERDVASHVAVVGVLLVVLLMFNGGSVTVLLVLASVLNGGSVGVQWWQCWCLMVVVLVLRWW